MNCEDFTEKAQHTALIEMDEHERWLVLEHVAHCADCKDALRGSEAMRHLANLPVERPATELFERTMKRVALDARSAEMPRKGFWAGATAGAGVAAALFAAIGVALLSRGVEVAAPAVAEFYVSAGAARDMDIAIDAQGALPGATLSLTVYGGIELAGYPEQRHLTWTTDLDPGVNRLTLPIVAIDDRGGQVIVRLDHPESHQEFLVQVLYES